MKYNLLESDFNLPDIKLDVCKRDKTVIINTWALKTSDPLIREHNTC